MADDGSPTTWLERLDAVGAWWALLGAGVLALWRRVLAAALGLFGAGRLVGRWGRRWDAHLATSLDAATRSTSETVIRLDVIDRILGVGVWMGDARGHVVAASRTLGELFGRDSSDLLGRGWLAAVADADRERVAECWARATSGDPWETSFAVHRRRDGDSIEVYSEGRAVIGQDGQVVAIVAWAIDSTGLRDALRRGRQP